MAIKAFKLYELPEPPTPFQNDAAVAALAQGSVTQPIVVDNDVIRSGAFKHGISGWALNPDGTIEAQDAIIRGDITATVGYIGAFVIGTEYIRDVANSFGLASTVTAGDDIRFWAGDTFANRATAPFRVLESGKIVSSKMTITGGSISGTSLDIGTTDAYFRYNPVDGATIKGSITILNPEDISGSDITNDQGWTDDSSLNTFVNDVYTGEISSLQNQIDGQITTWFYAYVPTLINIPASDWTTDSLKNDHLGDLFYDTTSGYAYRFLVFETVYSWQQLSDSDIAAALLVASNAQDTADGKRRVFTTTPTTPYNVGDLWLTSLSPSTGDIKKCITEKLTGAYESAHWVVASKYTDDTVANSKITTFLQIAVPTSISIGDIWIDTDDGNKMYRAESIGADEITAGEWILVQLAGGASIFAQDAIPTSLAEGDLWYDTDDGNKLYRAASAGADEIKVGEWVAITTSFDNLIDLPSVLSTPAGAGLYISATHLGYYDSAAWKTYMDSSGNFYLGGTSGKFQWSASTDTGIISGWTLNATTLSTAGIILDAANQQIRVGAITSILIDGINKLIESDNYVSGVFGAGFHIDSNLLEVGNIAARGLIRSAVFQKDVVSVVGGNLAVLDSDVLSIDMLADEYIP